MSRRLALILAVALGVLLAWAVGRAFVTNVGGPATEGAAGVVLAPPPDAIVEAAGELGPEAAARALAAHAGRNPGKPRVAITAGRAGTRIVLVLDREAGTIEELRGGPSGTRVGTVWKGGVPERLAAARDRGTFEVPGLAPPEEKNLYH